MMLRGRQLTAPSNQPMLRLPEERSRKRKERELSPSLQELSSTSESGECPPSVERTPIHHTPPPPTMVPLPIQFQLTHSSSPRRSLPKIPHGPSPSAPPAMLVDQMCGKERRQRRSVVSIADITHMVKPFTGLQQNADRWMQTFEHYANFKCLEKKND